MSHSINEKFNEMSDVGEAYLPTDACFTLKFLTGAYMDKSKNVAALFNFPIRCTSWNSTLEIQGLSTDVPTISISPILGHHPNARELLVDEINQAIAKLEKLSGESCTNTKLQKTFQMTQDLKDIYKDIIFDVQAGGKYPCNSKTYAQLVVLFEIAFQDYLSDLPLFVKIMRDLRDEIKSKLISEYVDVSHRPKILFATRYGGYDSYVRRFSSRTRSDSVRIGMIGFMDPFFNR